MNPNTLITRNWLAALGALLILGALIYFVAHFWAYIVVTVLAIVVAAIVAVVASKAFESSSTGAVASGLVALLLVMFFGYRNVSFDHQMVRLEHEFVHAASCGPVEIRGQNLDYGGELSRLIEKRDELCRRYWHNPHSYEWWVNTDKGIFVNGEFRGYPPT